MDGLCVGLSAQVTNFSSVLYFRCLNTRGVEKQECSAVDKIMQLLFSGCIWSETVTVHKMHIKYKLFCSNVRSRIVLIPVTSFFVKHKS